MLISFKHSKNMSPLNITISTNFQNTGNIL